MTTPSSMNSLLHALGLSVAKPSPPSFTFKDPNPMGTIIQTNEEDNNITSEEGESENEWFSLSVNCNVIIIQAFDLLTAKECQAASNRVLTAIQTHASRRVILKLLSLLSVTTPSLPDSNNTASNNSSSIVEEISLDNIQHLIRLLRLVQAKRDGLEERGEEMRREVQNCVESTISSVASSSEKSASQLLQVNHVQYIVYRYFNYSLHFLHF